MNVPAVVEAQLALSWTDNEPFSKNVGMHIGMFCAQVALDRGCNMRVLFLDAGISTVALLTSASFGPMYRYLPNSNASDDEAPSMPNICVCATTDPIYYPEVEGEEAFVEFMHDNLTNIVYPRAEPDR